MLENIIKVFDNEDLLGIIIKDAPLPPGVNFITDINSSFQLAGMHHPKGYIIQPHTHNNIKREIEDTQEVIFIKKGKVKVNFYNRNRLLILSHILTDGDFVLLTSGGHGFEILEPTEMYEVKQGPYAGGNDKTRFEPKDKEENEK